MSYKTLLFDVRDSVARITIHRTEQGNSLNDDFMQEFFKVVLQCDEDPAIRAVVLTGSGPIFCSGGDIRMFAGQKERLPLFVKEGILHFHGAISRIARMNAPVVVAVNGVAAGAGLSLVCAGDIAYAAESAKFTMAYTKIGLTPDGSSTFFLPRVVGLKRALELALTNRVLSAEEALNWGIVSRVLPDKDLMSEATAIATQLAKGATMALGEAKRLLRNGWNETLETQMENETQAIANAARTADAQEGIRAFVEKRAPKFVGG